ncbi:CopG family transcriptional regulator [Staphylococcus pseudintermedius]|nr:CopG family transcriptional regulator [Staphylococcus pseudintermedius]MDF0323197.1 CopG family transcriptional regulator [Staphylococcus pseudintermedius]MDF0327742.1 CopG family transcriptional regulator [Staphylococcus pseudintermedius]MDF0332092.1 CopG family transcriptional regulator [Staphylococcus pseudintermedius]MDF0336735.1 CopG family transcriptional regulator [Staphylococcus pseudintermedius]
MAFNANDKDHNAKVQESLKSTNKGRSHFKSNNNNISSDGTLHIPKKEPIEKKKNYTFSLTPSVRKNIERMANENNYESSSELLNTLFKE